MESMNYQREACRHQACNEGRQTSWHTLAAGGGLVLTAHRSGMAAASALQLVYSTPWCAALAAITLSGAAKAGFSAESPRAKPAGPRAPPVRAKPLAQSG